MKKILGILVLIGASFLGGVALEDKYDVVDFGKESLHFSQMQKCIYDGSGLISGTQNTEGQFTKEDGDELNITPSEKDIPVEEEESLFSWLNKGDYPYLSSSERLHLVDNVSLEKVDLVYSLLRKYGNDSSKMTKDSLEEWLIRGMIYSLEDPHTDFFNEVQGKEFNDDMAGDFEGIGAALEKRKEALVITEVLRGFPAAHSGLLPGDIILSVDKKSVQDETIWETILRIRGKKGTKVVLGIFRQGEKKEITVTRDTIHVESVEFSWKGKNKEIAVFEISQFGDDMIIEMKKNLQKLEDERKNGKKVKGIIIDLRYNGGGYLTGAVDLASFFLSEKTKVVSVAEKNTPLEDYFTKKPHVFNDVETPLIVMINGGSASASEIFAGAMQDLKRGKVVGTKSYGKGSVQQVFPLEKNPEEFVKITIAKWLLPSGRNITHEESLTPDVEVKWDRSEMTDEEIEKKYDPQMDKAIDILEK